MSEIITFRENIEVTNSEVTKIFTFALEGFPFPPRFELLVPGPNPEEDARAVTAENALRDFMYAVMNSSHSAPVKILNGEGNATVSVPYVFESINTQGETTYENFVLTITIFTTEFDITDYSVVLGGENFRGTPPSQNLISIDSTSAPPV